MKIKFKKYNKDAVIPKKAHDSDACYDIVATSKEDLGDGRIKYGLGFGLQMETQNEVNKTVLNSVRQIDLRARSSVHKTGMILSNCIGTGDEGYTGEYQAVFYDVIKSLPNYEVGDRILQMQVQFSKNVEFEEVDELGETERGDNGWGSSGK